jgi:hypothetical protein
MVCLFRITQDSIRRTVLEELGYRVISVTNELFSNPIQMERLAQIMADVLVVQLAEVVDKAWIERCKFHKRLRNLATHRELLLR